MGFPLTILSLVIVLLVFVWMTFRKLRIIISDTHLIAGFGFIKHVLRINNIESDEVTKAPWYMYGGYGIRFWGDWTVSYIQTWRREVRVVPKRGRVLYFSSNRPDEIEKIFQDLKNDARKCKLRPHYFALII